MNYLNTTKKQRRDLLEISSLDEKIKIAKDIIKQSLAIAKRPIVQFSGGADSCAMGWFVNQIDKTVPMVFHDWGLFLPRTKEFAEEYFKKYNIKYRIDSSGYDYKSFLKEKGLPLFKGFRPFINKNNYKNIIFQKIVED